VNERASAPDGDDPPPPPGRPPPPPPTEAEAQPAPTDAELDVQHKLIEVNKERTALLSQRDKLDTERANRRLRESFAKGALAAMVLQIIAANAVFVWYGDTNGWDIPGMAISAWLGATVVQVVAVVLVIMNYLFPRGGPPG
jgi:hypothetical protein